MYNAKTLAMIQKQERELCGACSKSEPEEYRVPFDPVALIEDWASLNQERVEALIKGGYISREDAYMKWAVRLREYIDNSYKYKEKNNGS